MRVTRDSIINKQRFLYVKLLSVYIEDWVGLDWHQLSESAPYCFVCPFYLHDTHILNFCFQEVSIS